MPKPPAFRRRAVAAWPLLGLACLFAGGAPGCGKRVGVPASPADVPGYLAPPPSLAGVDPTPLRGRRILLDPGHGGRFRGAIGHGGLTEAEINLGVALYLAGMLRWAGADVHLTRTADVDLLTPADSSLVADLAARVAISDSLAPDVFLSIHHNSTPSRDPTINETQTYYPLGREGADLDLARAIHRRLVLALGITPARILPGGFYVLRHVSAPAVLGEPAMLSNPVIEGRLSLARSLELEASAYFLGLRDYFAAGTPRWTTALPDTIDLATGAEPLVWTFDAGSPQAPALDPATVVLTCDGNPLPVHLDPAAGAVRLLPRDLPSGARLELSARNLAGRATPRQAHELRRRHDGPWRTLLVQSGDGATPPRALFTYRNDGQDLHDCGELRLGRTCGGATAAAADPPAGATALPVYPGPRGWVLLEQPSFPPHELRIFERTAGGAWQLHAGTAPRIATLPPSWRWLWLDLDRTIWRDAAVPGDGWRLRVAEDGGELPGPLAAEVLDPAWPAVPWPEDRLLWLEASGARPLLRLPAGAAPWPWPAARDSQDVALGGPAALVATAGDTLVWQPLLPQLVGRRIALDPRGGGTEEQGRGPLGTRGSDLNLQVARRLAALLRGAGCEVRLLREDETWLPDPQKVRAADRFGADLYLALGRGTPSVLHHPGSRQGEPWARRTAAVLDRLLAGGAGEVAVVAAYDYVLRHTACPAILVALEPPVTAAVEERLATPAWQDAVARALLRGTVALLQPDAEALDIAQMLAALGERAVGGPRLTYARLDGNLQWLAPGAAGDASVTSWRGADPGLVGRGGAHVLELHGGPHWQLWALVRQPEGNWHGQLLLENR